MQDCIEKEIVIHAPQSRVWQAIADSRQFGEWFKVRFDTPFVEGEAIQGQITHPGYEHVRMTITVTAIQPESLFAFTWLPYAIDPKVDYSGETPTTIEFRLTTVAEGTHLRVTECGFANVPEWRREIALRMNDSGWAQQVVNIRNYVERES